MSTNRLITSFFALIFAVTLYQTFRTPKEPTRQITQKQETCKGTAIEVDYDYTGEIHVPHSCKVQCETGTAHYILYTNNVGTQCEKLPGCNDWGEDNGETCVPPVE